MCEQREKERKRRNSRYSTAAIGGFSLFFPEKRKSYIREKGRAVKAEGQVVIVNEQDCEQSFLPREKLNCEMDQRNYKLILKFALMTS